MGEPEKDERPHPKSPAFQWYPRDFLSSAKVDRMSMTERGVYVTLLSRCWLDNGLPTDIRELAGLVRMSQKQFERMWVNGQVGRCFSERAGKFHNDRLDEERRKQADYRRRQTDRAEKRWSKRDELQSTGNATALQAVQSSGNALLSASASASASATQNKPRPTAPLVTSHKSHAACGRVCVPAFLHTEFMGRRNTPDAYSDLLRFYTDVDNEWSDGGLYAGREPGEPVAFWRARYEERWPSTGGTKAARRPAWSVK